MLTKSQNIKGIEYTINFKEHSLMCVNADTQMILYVQAAKHISSNLPEGSLLKDECESAFNELFAAHRILSKEEIFEAKGGELKIALNGHTFVSKGYDETDLVLHNKRTFKAIRLSTKDGFTIDSLYQFHDDIKAFLDNNSITL